MKIKPNLENSSLTRKIFGLDEYLKRRKIDVIEEKPITLYLNSQEIVTMMTINDFPEYLAIGYLLNQNMITKTTKIESVEYYADLKTVVVRTKKSTNFEADFLDTLKGFLKLSLRLKIGLPMLPPSFE